MSGVDDIASERWRQIFEEGWTHAHDDRHSRGEMAAAAVTYLLHGAQSPAEMRSTPVRWPWSADWWKPKDRRADLVRAGALIAAEIDRLDRLEARR